MADEPTAEEKAQAEKEAADAKAAADKAKADEEAAAKKKAEEEAKLGDAGKAALDSERKARREADKRAKEAQDKLDAIEAEKLSETEKAAKRATEAEAKLTDATDRLRRANLIAELSKPEHGIVSAAAAAKLIEGVEYSDDGEPTNVGDLLPSFLEANAFLKGEQQQTQTTQTQTLPFGGGAQPNTQTVDLTEDELLAAKSFGMTPEEYAKNKDPQAAAQAAAAPS
jgi:hypothetical protein